LCERARQAYHPNREAPRHRRLALKGKALSSPKKADSKDADEFGESFEALQVVDPTRPRKPNNRTAKYLRTKKGFFTPKAP
jgi:hypothetical protein